MKQKILNLFLRGSAIGIRFLFVFFLGKFISLEFLGNYSLWNTTITLALLLVGFDFYVYSIRNILKKKQEEQWSLVKNHLVFVLLSYIIFAPLLFLIFALGFLEIELIGLFYLVLILEHFGMELYRLFTALEKPVFANLLLLIRTATWMLVFVGIWYVSSFDNPGMKEILICWSISALIANGLGWVVLRNQYKNLTWEPTDWAYIKKGIRISVPLFLATLTLKIIEFSDRYMIDYFLTKKDLGIFSFFYQLSNLVNVVIYTVVIMILYPKLYKAIFEKKDDSVRIKKQMIRQSVLIWIGLSIFILLITPFLVQFMNKPEMVGFDVILYYMLPASLFFNFYFIYKTCLNAYEMDMILLKIGILAAVVNFVLNLVLMEKIGIYAASLSSLVSYFILATATYGFEKRAYKNHHADV